MKLPPLENDTASVVLLGDFNPKIFHPAWFAANGLIRQREAEALDPKLELTHPEYSAFATEGFKLSVSKKRFSIQSSGSGFRDMVRDLVTGTFTLLSHTPIRTLGVNREFQFRMASEDAWHGVGDALVPKKPWSDLLKRPGMEHLHILSPRSDDYSGSVRVIVKPSDGLGVYVQVNDQYNLDDADAFGAQRVMEILPQVWEKSLSFSLKVTETMFESL